MFGSQVIRWAVVVAVASVAGGVAARVVETPGVIVSYDTPSAVVLHEPIIVEFRLSNGSSDSIHFDLGFNRQAGFTVQVKTPDGAVHTPRIVERGLGRGGRLVLGPKEELSHQLLLNDWLRFDQIGEYEIAIQLNEPIRTQSGGVVDTPAAIQFHLDVGPPDPSRLQNVCRHLADTIIGSKRAEDRLNAAHAISWIEDPVVLPFMQEILFVTDEADPILVKGLARMKHVEARSLLTEMAQSDKEERAALGRSGLQRSARPQVKRP